MLPFIVLTMSFMVRSHFVAVFFTQVERFEKGRANTGEQMWASIPEFPAKRQHQAGIPAAGVSDLLGWKGCIHVTHQHGVATELSPAPGTSAARAAPGCSLPTPHTDRGAPACSPGRGGSWLLRTATRLVLLLLPSAAQEEAQTMERHFPESHVLQGPPQGGELWIRRTHILCSVERWGCPRGMLPVARWL